MEKTVYDFFLHFNVPITVEVKTFRKGCRHPKENIDSCITFWDAARNMGMNSLFSGNVCGKKPHGGLGNTALLAVDKEHGQKLCSLCGSLDIQIIVFVFAQRSVQTNTIDLWKYEFVLVWTRKWTDKFTY